jgi:hypothetical protein
MIERMVRKRQDAALAALVVVAGCVGLLSQCAEPTQIVVDVRTNACRFIKSSGIAVATWETIDQAPLSTYKSAENGGACETEDRIGTLTVYPSGDSKEGEVGLRIVAGVDKLVTECGPPWDGCLVARRRVRFEPGRSQQLIVVLSLACKGKDCGLGSDCTANGECVRLPGEDVVDKPDTGAPDVVVVPPPEAGADACNSCLGVGQTCTAGHQCTTDCSMQNCTNPAVCPAPLDCTYRCTTQDSCDDALCVTTGACKIECNVQSACNGTTCRASRCDIECNANDSCREVALSGGDAGLTCRSGVGDPCRASSNCDAGKCTLNCMPGGGDNGTCPNNPNCQAQPSGTQCVGPW